ncbi:MAG: PIN domain-containing protein [Prevotella sp.]|nr:PIN domain-containing protein [Prevotella sp.]
MMKVFLDTNIFAEYIFRRERYSDVERLFVAITANQIEAYTSNGTFYTLAYITERMLKQQGYRRPELISQMRAILVSLLNLVHVIGLDQTGLTSATMNESFTDIEDSFQYQCALIGQCDKLITINIDDFRGADQTHLEVFTPRQFNESFLNSSY